MSASIPRSHIKGETHPYISPVKEINVGIWTLFTGASLFLGLRLWCKISRRYGMWFDDYILIVSWVFAILTPLPLTKVFLIVHIVDPFYQRHNNQC